MDDIASRIKKLRQERSLSMEMFAETIGYSKSYISMIENDERPVTDAVTKEIMKKYNLNKEWFIYGKGEVFDKERTALKAVYLDLYQIIKRYPNDCKCFKSLLIPAELERLDVKGNGLTVFDRFPSLTFEKFYMSEIEPEELIGSLIVLYQSIKNALEAHLKLIH